MGKNLTIFNVSIEGSPNWTLHVANFSGIHIHDIEIHNAQGYNRDGIDIDCSQNALVENSLVDAGDDALCVKSGEDWVGRHDAVRAENIIFRNIEVGTGHGITIGSDMAAGVRNVSVSSQPRRVSLGISIMFAFFWTNARPCLLLTFRVGYV
jgi:polygalacturonase